MLYYYIDYKLTVCEGVFVSSVDPRSDACTQGLCKGDEILEANDIDLSRTSAHDAWLILGAARSLTLTVRHASIVGAIALRYVSKINLYQF